MPTGRATTLLPTLRRVVLGREAADRPDADLVAAFTRDRDADAFAELVRRHGPMVLGVCRRVVGDWAAADDAFQATFLVLARRAAAVRPRSAVGNWLYGVAYRTAAKARAVLARRRSREKQVEAMPEPPVRAAEDLWSDVRPVIDEELARLPERLRLPVVLCDLEGRPQRQVARHLNVPPATLATRLASARRLLAARLTRRGVALSGGALATVLGGNATAAVAPRVADGLVRAAEAVCAGSGVGSLVSAHAVQLSEGVMRMMLLSKLRAVGAAALATLALTTGLGFGLVPAHASDPGPGEKPTAAAAAKPPAAAVPVDDATFFRRACLDLRGSHPSLIENVYFLADTDATKRRKVVDWLLTDEAVKAYQAKKLGVPADRLHIIAFVDVGTVERELTIADFGQPSAVVGEIAYFLNQPAAAVNGNNLVGGKIVLNEVNYDLLPWTTTAGRINANYWVEAYNHPATVTPQLYSLYRSLRLYQPQAQAIAFSPDQPTTTLVFSDGDPPIAAGQPILLAVRLDRDTDTDADFLRKAVQAARGTAPSAVEEKYFAEDKDPKKREKLLDLLLKDPAVAKKLGDDWKKKMLATPTQAYGWKVETRPQTLIFRSVDRNVRVWDAAGKAPGRLEKLAGELLAAKKPDDQVLDGLSLTALGRLPTEGEKSLTLAAVGKAADKKAAWADVAKALAATEEAKKHAAELNKTAPSPPKPEKK